MPAMRGHPPDQRTLDRHAAEDTERPDNGGTCLEARMSEETVKPDRDSEAGQKVHHAEERQIHGAEKTSPEKDHGRNHADRRQEDHHDAYELPEKGVGLYPTNLISRTLRHVLIGDFFMHGRYNTTH